MRTTKEQRDACRELAVEGFCSVRGTMLENLLDDLDELEAIAKYYLNHGSTPELQQMCRAARTDANRGGE